MVSKRNNRSGAGLLAFLLGSTVMAGGAAAAADGAAQSAQNEPPVVIGLESVTVTAQKQEENLQDVPFSVSALTGKALEAFQYKDLQNLNGVIPNVLFTQMSNVSLTLAPSIRGIGLTNNPDPYTGTEVAVVIDGVVQGTRLLGLSDQFDVERIEVLRGPQGTLFGADTLGGVVNIVSKQPTGHFGVYGEVTKGNYNETNAAVAVNFPLIENVLAGKVSVSQRARDGFFTNEADGQDLMWVNSTKLRGYLLFTPTSDLTATFTAGRDRIRNGADVAQNVSLPDELFWRPGVTDRPVFSLYSDSVQPNDADLSTYSLNVNWQTPIGEITSISNFTNFTAHNIQDVDALPEFLMNAGREIESRQRSQELRLSTNPTDNTKLLAGVFFM
ncbi:MAG TPA: TonB-dependent receptor plug domain-containing protein, partial [Rhizomicrobium sp.]|nr:TonB-dependent receptor plug domain-containing protein [Rhizomicrobium sp.]